MTEFAMLTIFLVMLFTCIVCVGLIGFFLVEAYKYLDRELFWRFKKKSQSRKTL
jgi:hypothetical protein